MTIKCITSVHVDLDIDRIVSEMYNRRNETLMMKFSNYISNKTDFILLFDVKCNGFGEYDEEYVINCCIDTCNIKLNEIRDELDKIYIMFENVENVPEYTKVQIKELRCGNMPYETPNGVKAANYNKSFEANYKFSVNWHVPYHVTKIRDLPGIKENMYKKVFDNLHGRK